jgi:hypothetical protein
LNKLRLHSLWYRFSYKYYEEDLEKQYLIHEKIYASLADREANLGELQRMVHDHIEVAFEKFIGYLTNKTGDSKRVIPIDNAVDSPNWH